MDKSSAAENSIAEVIFAAVRGRKTVHNNPTLSYTMIFVKIQLLPFTI